jgi:hypothetical protein
MFARINKEKKSEKKKILNSTHTHAHEIMQTPHEITNPSTQPHIIMQVFIFP